MRKIVAMSVLMLGFSAYVIADVTNKVDVIVEDGVTYSRRGSLGRDDYVATEVNALPDNVDSLVSNENFRCAVSVAVSNDFNSVTNNLMSAVEKKRDKMDMDVYKLVYPFAFKKECLPVVYIYDGTTNIVSGYELAPMGGYEARYLKSVDSGYCQIEFDTRSGLPTEISSSGVVALFGGRAPVLGEWPILDSVNVESYDRFATGNVVSNLINEVKNDFTSATNNLMSEVEKKRDKMDLDVYKVQVGDWRVVQVSDGSDPATWTIRTAGVNPGVYEIYAITRPNLPGEIFFNNLNYEGKTSATVADTIADVRYVIHIERTIAYVPTGDHLATGNMVSNLINEVKSEFYDEELQVNWTMKMVNGEMKLYATTNVNMSTL